MSKSRWGIHTWIFIHTFCYHISDELFRKDREKIITFLFKICTNVPCPTCEKDARNYLAGRNKKWITTKERCKEFFYAFHNHVNKKTHKPIFTDFDKYKNANLTIAFKNFQIVFTENYHLRNKLHKSFARRTLCKDIYNYITSNKHHFSLC